METGITDEQKLSKLNSGYWINLRLHNMWEECHKHKTKDNFYSWNKTLDSIWCELGGDEKEGEQNDIKYQNMDNKLFNIIKIEEFLHTIGGNFGHNKPDIKLLRLKNAVYKLLIKKELFLRRLQNKQGKGTAYKDEEDDWE